MNKKGILLPLVNIFGIILMIYAAFAVYSAANQPATVTLGILQTDIVKLQIEGEQKMFYIDQLAKFAGYNTVKSLAENGVVDCESWTLINECDPIQAYNGVFEKQFAEEFKKLTEKNYFVVPEFSKFSLIYEKDDAFIIGESNQPLKLRKTADYKVNYEIKPNFKVKINTYLEDYKRIISQLYEENFMSCIRSAVGKENLLFNPEKSAYNLCKDKIKPDLERDFKWSFDKEDGVVIFIVNSKVDTAFIGNIDYRFAIDLNKSPFLKISAR
ncbi:MAG: hypothetical protein Q8R00_03635 [Candidatus Nanoarchaeia archaeon]|nr:hypothetical protein [Candidatus Nanoarchaeia archaeon]